MIPFNSKNSLTFSSPWWVKAPGVKYCRILRDSIFYSFCHSFLKIMLGNRRAPSVIYSTTGILTLEIPFILHRNYSEVLPAFFNPPTCNRSNIIQLHDSFCTLSQLSSSHRWVLPPGGGQVPTTVCQVPEKATVVLSSAVLPQTGEADSCL